MSQSLDLFTIGFTKKTAQQFFEMLQKNGVKRVIDTRLNNASQLAGFAKKKDLQYFLKTIGNIEYVHLLDLAPTKDILDNYKKKKIDWETYESKFTELITKRKIETKVSPEDLQGACLLCSEAKPHHCHRRLVAEYFQQTLTDVVKIHHLE
ncbi:DUF488 domain-containing protein [Spirulina sp. CS-785/01]|uniref:DUF488 domain-containing protein n=1 Tax=Spirulina sp. CS-785/01 TaxID=3021716 RepID=UPI00232AE1B4|nr:DUF488 domain-containing protein [Spirulina sp. CS-785/01]MDB9315349.1 DUF488 domain-containing protein [Spirulina sp. CS-785/01]